MHLALETPTTQVKLLACELLRDGKIHTRREITGYIEARRQEEGLPPFREGHWAGGIEQAVAAMNCEKIKRATYRARNVPEQRPFSMETAAEICRSAADQLIALSRDVDFVTAEDDQLEKLSKLRECVRLLRTWQDAFQAMR